MNVFYTPQELAALLKVDVEIIHQLVQSGQMRAFRIGGEMRIGENDFANYLEQSVVTAVPAERTSTADPVTSDLMLAPHENRPKECPTFGGQSTFSYSGSVATGTIIWPSKKANYKLRFDAAKWALLLDTFRGKEVRAGLNFAQPEEGSFGQWIKQHFDTKMGPAAYVGGILIKEGYASRPRPGWIKVFAQGQPAAPERD
jgi:excisionase family DNA binding protein